MHEWPIATLQELLAETEDQEHLYQTKYSTGVLVTTPVELLQRIDRAAEGHAGFTRQSIFLRAVRTYLAILEQVESSGGQPEADPGSLHGRIA